MTTVPAPLPPRRRALVCVALASLGWGAAGPSRAGPPGSRSAPDERRGAGPYRSTGGTAAERRFALAADYHRSNAWARAYGEFLALANDGHAEAAAIVLFMHRMGPALYGSYWDLGTEEQADLEQLVREGGGRRASFVAPPAPEPRAAPSGGAPTRVARGGTGAQR